jgi:predicted ester cyclase
VPGVLRRLDRAFPDAHVDVAEVHVISDVVVVERGTFTGTHDGVLRTPAGEVPPTGRPVVLDYVHVLHIARGRHVSFDLMFDRLALLEQLGLAEAPLAPGHGR